MRAMTRQRIGIDTSVLVRLITGSPFDVSVIPAHAGIQGRCRSENL